MRVDYEHARRAYALEYVDLPSGVRSSAWVYWWRALQGGGVAAIGAGCEAARTTKQAARELEAHGMVSITGSALVWAPVDAWRCPMLGAAPAPVDVAEHCFYAPLFAIADSPAPHPHSSRWRRWIAPLEGFRARGYARRALMDATSEARRRGLPLSPKVLRAHWFALLGGRRGR